MHKTSIQQDAIKVQVTANSNLLKVRVIDDTPYQNRPGGGRRGSITAFSAASRKRLLEKMATIDYEKVATFMTLTFPDECHPSTIDRAKQNLRALLERFRRAFSEMSAIWRMEIEPRKSGDFVGQPMPHFHLIAFNMPFLSADILRAWWAEIIGYTGSKKLRIGIEACRSKRKATYYVAKYMGKVSAASEPFSGEAACYLVNVAYLHAGRHWGVFNRDKLPVGEALVMIIEGGIKWFNQLRRGASHKWHRIPRNSKPVGWSLFVESADRWIDFLYFCLLE